MNQKQLIMLEEEQDALNCEYCSQKKAEIFQATGYYRLQCWQEETHPNV
jgi:thioredoxin-related protein